MVYFDQSATSVKKPDVVIEAVNKALVDQLGNPSRGGHDYSLNGLKAVSKARHAVGDLFGVKALNVALTFNATVGLNMVIKGALSPGDHVITSTYEHNSSLRPLYQMEEEGAELDVMPLEEDGSWSIKTLENYIKDNTKAIVVNAMSNVTGDVAPIDELVKYCKENDLLLILDISQWAGTRPLKVTDDWPEAYLVATGHKSLYGPQGSGIILKHGDFQLKNLLSGGSGVHSFDHNHPSTFPEICEPGTLNVHGAAGLAAGAKWVAEKDPAKIQVHLKELRNYFRREVAAIPRVKIYGTDNEDAGPVCGINIGDVSSGKVSDELNQKYHIATRPGAHCAPLMHEHYGTEDQGIVRFSFSSFNTKEEVDQALEALAKIEQTL